MIGEVVYYSDGTFVKEAVFVIAGYGPERNAGRTGVFCCPCERDPDLKCC